MHCPIIRQFNIHCPTVGQFGHTLQFSNSLLLESKIIIYLFLIESSISNNGNYSPSITKQSVLCSQLPGNLLKIPDIAAKKFGAAVQTRCYLSEKLERCCKVSSNCSTLLYISLISILINITKLDRVSPIDNRPSTDKPHHFVEKKKEEKKM